MSWNYRVIEFPGEEPHGESWCGIHEVYYTEDGKPRAYSSEPRPVIWETVDGLEAANDVINQMLEAINKPILKPSDFPNGSKQ